MTTDYKPIPTAGSETGLDVLKDMLRARSFLAALRSMHTNVGALFKVTLPGFQPIVLVGPENNRKMLVSQRDQFDWRTESDAVTGLLRRGVLVVDGDEHDLYRDLMNPALVRRAVPQHIPAMSAETDRVITQWRDGQTVDMLVEMRKVALLILMRTLYGVDFMPDMERLWKPILKLLKYISPGLWIVWPTMPRPQYRRAIKTVDDYLYRIIRERRNNPQMGSADDLLGRLIAHPAMTDDLIRDQLLTMMIAGHDTSTALMAWIWVMLGTHPDTLMQVQTEIDTVIGTDQPAEEHMHPLSYCDQVIKETLRMYPPIHIGNRRANTDIPFDAYQIPVQSRVMYSIYTTHRDPEHWENPDKFEPERFCPHIREKRPALAYVPFGGGPRNCIGAAFSQIEAKVIMARVLQQFELEPLQNKVHPHMGATLEPRPGVKIRVHRRS
ncbi:MAG: cytochrome P450 [Anaerolineae bacterium]|nr:cytochrome P450 [Anaerolineae bacterium]